MSSALVESDQRSHHNDDVIPDLDTEIYRRFISIQFGNTHQNPLKEFPRFNRYFDKNYSRHLPQDKNATIVDIGCGMGHFLYYLKHKGYTHYLGIDTSSECVAFCKQNGFNCEQGDAIEWLRNNQADAIVANDILEHLDRHQLNELLYFVNKSLKPGGVFITKVPNAANPITGGALRYIDYTHKTSFTEVSLAQMLKVYFSKTQVKGQNLFVFYENPLNYIGMLGHFIFDKIFYLLSVLYGQSEHKIFKKSIISISQKEIGSPSISTESL